MRKERKKIHPTAGGKVTTDNKVQRVWEEAGRESSEVHGANQKCWIWILAGSLRTTSYWQRRQRKWLRIRLDNVTELWRGLFRSIVITYEHFAWAADFREEAAKWVTVGWALGYQPNCTWHFLPSYMYSVSWYMSLGVSDILGCAYRQVFAMALQYVLYHISRLNIIHILTVNSAVPFILEHTGWTNG